jgi:hypothetical protein
MNTTTVRRIVRTTLTTTLALGAFAFVAAPQAAQAQRFAVGVQIGQPAYGYVAPRPAYGYDRDDRFRAEEFRAQQFRNDQFHDHEAWERQQAFARREELDRQRFHFDHQQYDRREAYDRGNGWR